MNCHVLNCCIWEQGCVINWDAVPAWIQAIFSVAAIVWASKSAMKQIAAQHENDKKLRHQEIINRQTILIVALRERVNLIKRSVETLLNNSRISQIERRTLKKHEINIYVNVFQEALKDIKNLSIYELRNPEMITLHIMLRNTITEIQFNCNLFVNCEVIYTATDFKEYENALKNATPELSDYEDKLSIELEDIKTNKSGLYN